MARSYLFIPGNVPRMLQTMDVFEADALIIDFEDAVDPGDKDEARHLTRAFLRSHSVEPPLYVRINTDPEMMKRDMAFLEGLNIDGIVLPKASPQTLEAFDALKVPMPIIALVETPGAFFDLPAIVSRSDVRALFLGGEDLTRALGATRTLSGESILFARSQIILAAAAYGIDAIDTPLASTQSDSVHADSQTAQALGFDAKAAIHPNQVPLINKALSPSPQAIERAQRIVTMHDQTGKTRFSLDGEMVDTPIISRARDLIARAKRYGLLKEDAYAKSHTE